MAESKRMHLVLPKYAPIAGSDDHLLQIRFGDCSTADYCSLQMFATVESGGALKAMGQTAAQLRRLPSAISLLLNSIRRPRPTSLLAR
jgi:hypothetical protein